MSLSRKDSGFEAAVSAEQPTTPSDDYSSPEITELSFPNANWIQADSQQSTPSTSVKIAAALKENLPPSDWMDQIDASDELKQRREATQKTRIPNSAFKTTFLQLPNQYERYY